MVQGTWWPLASGINLHVTASRQENWSPQSYTCKGLNSANELSEQKAVSPLELPGNSIDCQYLDLS